MDLVDWLLGLFLLFMGVGTLGIMIWLCVTMGY